MESLGQTSARHRRTDDRSDTRLSDRVVTDGYHRALNPFSATVGSADANHANHQGDDAPDNDR